MYFFFNSMLCNVSAVFQINMVGFLKNYDVSLFIQ